MQLFLLIAAIIFIAWDVLMGLRRGLFPSLVRLVFVGACFTIAYLTSEPLAYIIMETPMPFLGGETFHAAYEGYLLAQEGLAEALALSEAVEQLVFHLPDVLVSEVDFIVLFALLRLVSMPFSFIVSRILFGKPEKKARAKKAENTEGEEPVNEKKGRRSLAGRFRSGGAVIGLLQGVVCFAVLLVPLFGMVEFGERFHASFADAEEAVLADIAADIKEDMVDPINASPVTKVCESVGLRALAVTMFHDLSDTTLELSSGNRQIDYFEYLENMFPAVSALLKLSDVDPSHMTDKDYENLSIVLQTAQTHEDIAHAVKDGVTNVVDRFVEDSYRESADVVISSFADKVVSQKDVISTEQLKKEVEAVEKTMMVIQTATSESADTAFEVVSAETLVDHIIETEILYDTLIEVAADPEQREVLVKDFFATDEQKENMREEINKYRDQSADTRPVEEYARILEITDALADMLGIDLDALPGGILPE